MLSRQVILLISIIPCRCKLLQQERDPSLHSGWHLLCHSEQSEESRCKLLQQERDLSLHSGWHLLCHSEQSEESLWC